MSFSDDVRKANPYYGYFERGSFFYHLKKKNFIEITKRMRTIHFHIIHFSFELMVYYSLYKILSQ